MTIIWTTPDNRTVSLYATPEVDAKSVQGQYIGTGAPPGSWSHKVTLGFQPKHLIIGDPTMGSVFVAELDSSGLVPPPPGVIPADAIVTAGMAYGAALIAPVMLWVLFAPDGFYVDTFTNAPLPYNYYASV